MSTKSAPYPNTRDITDKILKEHFSKPVDEDSISFSSFDASISLRGDIFQVRVHRHFEPGGSVLGYIYFESAKQVLSFISTLLDDLAEAVNQRKYFRGILREARAKTKTKGN